GWLFLYDKYSFGRLRRFRQDAMLRPLGCKIFQEWRNTRKMQEEVRSGCLRSDIFEKRYQNAAAVKSCCRFRRSRRRM
ncbi:MAG: hypothetical protein SOV75_01795, partial [Candidatus Limiplasma sp.]|nr:hypothetical protein [Candidatus Limiplasma sp.]